MNDTQTASNRALVSDHLLADHRRFEKLLELLRAALASDERQWVQALWTQFEARLTVHLDLEDKYLIPVFARFDPDEARIILEEHARIRAQLAQLGVELDLHAVRVEMIRTFLRELETHARREDKLLYRWADEHFSASDRRSLLGGLQDAVIARLRTRRR